MDHGSQILLIIFLLLSFHCTHIMISTASRKTDTENAQEIRLLLGLKSYFHRKSRQACAPSPSPMYAPSPSPSPILPDHHAYSPRHQNPPSKPHHLHKFDKKGRKKSRKTIILVIASVGVGSLLCALGLLFGCKKLRKKTLSIYCSESGGIEAGNSAKMVLSEPVPDLFYLQALGAPLEPLKHNTVTPLNASETTGSENEFEIQEISPNGEILESGCHTLLSCDHNVTIPDDHHSHSSDDESFHSVCNSQSSQHLRSSSASAESCLEFLDINCSNDPKDLGYSVASPPRPPPSPPPLPLAPPPPLVCSRNKNNGLSPLSTLSTISSSSTGNIDSSSGSDQTPESNLSPATPKPPPPFLPPFESSLKVPPPPPSKSFQTTPLGKDGSPLPKLKPLHWDKVRATPNRTTVWDKLRSSSFE